MKKLFIHSFKTKLGMVRTAATSKGLAIVSLPNESRHYYEGKIEQYFSDHEIFQGGPINQKAEKQIRSFLDSKLKKFSLPLDIQATPFYRQVLMRVSKIPYGKTMSYGEIAAALGNPRAARAVGTANARNNLPLVVPCHRVVGSNGLGGYGGGLSVKKRLLKMEGAL